VANRLSSAFRLDAILLDVGAPISRRRRLKLILRRHTPAQLFSRALLKAWSIASGDDERRRRDIEAVLGEDARDHRFPHLIRRVQGINSRETVALLRDLSPEILLLYGTGIASAETLRTASKLVLNLHTGISPRYRGAHCAFWPLYNGEVDKIGATIHICTEHIDGGAILAQSAAVLQEDDSVHTIFARTVATGASLYEEAIRQGAAGYRGEPQDLSLGREYRSAMRGIMAELRARQRIREGLVRSYVRSKLTL